MARYLLDTNICIYLTRQQPPQVRRRFEALTREDLAMSVITLGELQFGVDNSTQRRRSQEALQRLLDAIPVEPVGQDVCSHYGEIRADLRKSGRPIGGNDLWIAAHARSQGWILVTNDEREFRRVKRLKVENWVGG